MVHRRLLHDDSYGSSEPLNEEAFGVGLAARGTIVVLTDGDAEVSSEWRRKVTPGSFHFPFIF
jgi:hypothetical protein